MKLRYLFFILFLIHFFKAHAQEQLDYQMIGFENESFRDFTTDELLFKLGINGQWIEKFNCGNLHQLDPFAAPLRSNDLGNSLKIEGSQSKLVLTYYQGKFYDDRGIEVKKIKDSFIKIVAKNFKELEKIKIASDLLRFFEKSYFPITIKRGMNSFAPTVLGGKTYWGLKMAQAIAIFETKRTSDDPVPFFDIGSGGFLYWDPESLGESIESDGKKRSAPPLISLAHEMYHAFDSIRGLLDLKFVKGENYEFLSRSEYRAVYFENRIREEKGYKLRKYYGADSGADVLDENNKPVYIPSSCLQSTWSGS